MSLSVLIKIKLKSMDELLDYLERYPGKGDIIQGTGGVRKLRWYTGKGNKGKSSQIQRGFII